MTFYRPQIVQVTSWLFAAVPGEQQTRNVNVPPVSTTQCSLFAAFTGISSGSIFNNGRGSYFSGSTLLTGGMGIDTSGMDAGNRRYAACGLVSEASNVGAGVALAPYVASGVRYSFNLGSGVNPIDAPVNAVLTIVVIDGPDAYMPNVRPAATVTSAHYAYTSGSGSSSGAVNIWLDAFYRTNVHLLSAWASQGSGLPNGNWWLAGEAMQPAANGLPQVYQSIAVTTNSPAASSAVASPVTYGFTPAEQWAMMAYESDQLTVAYVPPTPAAGRPQAMIVG